MDTKFCYIFHQFSHAAFMLPIYHFYLRKDGPTKYSFLYVSTSYSKTWMMNLICTKKRHGLTHLILVSKHPPSFCQKYGRRSYVKVSLRPHSSSSIWWMFGISEPLSLGFSFLHMCNIIKSKSYIAWWTIQCIFTVWSS